MIAALVQYALLLLTTGFFARCVYHIYFHPLASIPGPKIAACSSLWLAYHTFFGTECTAVYRLHQEYGPVLRVAPNDVDIDDGEAIDPIYIRRGGFAKSPAYSKFDIDQHATIFSTLTLQERANRAKAVAPLFATAAIRHNVDHGPGHQFQAVFDDFVARLRAESRTGKPVNVLNLARSMALDAVSTYLFQERYGAVHEASETTMSASPFVDAFVGVGAYFNLMQGVVGDALMHWIEWWTTSPKTEAAFRLIDSYTSHLVRTAQSKSGSYQSRLMERIPQQQAQTELKDVCFAGTDSTSMNVATILWYLARDKDTCVVYLSVSAYCLTDLYR